MLTDTTFWIDLLTERQQRKAHGATRFLRTHRAKDLRVSIITWGELAVGFNSPSEMQGLIDRVRILNLHLQVAWEAAKIERELTAQGLKLGENDNWIAATARVWGLRLVTRDAAFARVRGLSVISY